MEAGWERAEEEETAMEVVLVTELVMMADFEGGAVETEAGMEGRAVMVEGALGGLGGERQEHKTL